MIRQPYVRNLQRDPWFFIHIPAAVLWLFSGFVQLINNPKKNPRFHKANGILYVVLLILGAGSIFPITIKLRQQTIFGPNSYTMIAFSLISVILGLYYLSKKDYRRHSFWMIRSMIMPALIPVFRLAAAVTLNSTYFIWITFSAFITAELFIGGRLEKRIPKAALPIAFILCAMSFWLVFTFQWKLLKTFN